MRTFDIAILTAVSLGCSTSTGPRLGDEFELKVGEATALEDLGLWFAFVGASEDSRCPRQAICVWAGDAAVRVETAPFPDAVEADSKTHTLHTRLDPRLLQLGAVELMLVRLDPYPETPSSIPADAYVATFTTRTAQ